MPRSFPGSWRARRPMGRIDTVLANAGAALDQPAAPTCSSAWTPRTHCTCARRRARRADLPIMADGGGGAFLIMSSLSGLRGNRVLSGYGVTKAANAQLARNIAVQWGSHGIRANALSPGVIATESPPRSPPTRMPRPRASRRPRWAGSENRKRWRGLSSGSRRRPERSSRVRTSSSTAGRSSPTDPSSTPARLQPDVETAGATRSRDSQMQSRGGGSGSARGRQADPLHGAGTITQTTVAGPSSTRQV